MPNLQRECHLRPFDTCCAALFIHVSADGLWPTDLEVTDNQSSKINFLINLQDQIFISGSCTALMPNLQPECHIRHLDSCFVALVSDLEQGSKQSSEINFPIDLQGLDFCHWIL